MHQCSYARDWTQHEIRLFREIGRRITDALNGLLFLRDLRENEEKFKGITENATDVTIVLDENGVCRYVNPIIRKYGFTPDDVIDKNYSIIIHPDYILKIQDLLKEAINRPYESIKVGDIRINANDEDEIILDALATYMPKTAGVNGVVLNCRDITEHVRAEKENEKLEEQLLQAQKMQAIGQLAGGVAHDFNNLLTGIIGNLSLAEVDAPDKIRKYLENASLATDRAEKLVKQLLAFSRKAPIELKPLDLNQIVKDVYRLARETIDRRIEISIRTAMNLPCVHGDAAQLNSIITNLCLNARDAIEEMMENRSPKMQRNRLLIAIETATTFIDRDYAQDHPETQSGQYVILSVSDNGMGMDAETQRRIFEPFFTTKDIGKGTGLGLASVYGIVKQHFGWINVYSEPW